MPKIKVPFDIGQTVWRCEQTYDHHTCPDCGGPHICISDDWHAQEYRVNEISIEHYSGDRLKVTINRLGFDAKEFFADKTKCEERCRELKGM